MDGIDSTAAQPGSTDAASRISALTSLYVSERSEQASAGTVALSLIFAALTYSGVAVSQLEHLRQPALLEASLPIPLWIAVAFHTALTAGIFARNRSAELLEDALVEASGLTPHRSQIGTRAVRDVMDLHRQPWILKAQTLITFLGIGAFLLGGTYGAWLLVALDHGFADPVTLPSLAFYLVLTLLFVGAWRYLIKDLVRPERGGTGTAEQAVPGQD